MELQRENTLLDRLTWRSIYAPCFLEAADFLAWVVGHASVIWDWRGTPIVLVRRRWSWWKITINKKPGNQVSWVATLMCLKKDPILSFGTPRNSLIPSHTFTKSSTVLSFLPVLFPNCLQSSLGGVDLPYEIVWPYSNSLPYFSQMFNCTFIPSHAFPKSSIVLSLGFVFL